jgi:hypothetical protein
MAFKFFETCVPVVNVATGTVILRPKLAHEYVLDGHLSRGFVAACAWLNEIKFDAHVMYFYERRGRAQRHTRMYVFTWCFNTMVYRPMTRATEYSAAVTCGWGMRSEWIDTRAFASAMVAEHPPDTASHLEIASPYISPSTWTVKELQFTIKSCSPKVLEFAAADARRRKRSWGT